MTLGSIEVRVTWNDCASLHKVTEENILSSTSLMCRDDILKTGDLADSLLEHEERR